MSLNVLMAIGSPDFTGAPRMALIVARALRDAGHRVIVVTGQRPPADHSSVLDFLRTEGFETIEEVGFERGLPDRHLIRRISELARHEKIQCLISEEPQDFKVMPFVAKRTSIKLVYHVQNAAKFYGSFFSKTIKRYAYHWMVRRYTSKLICVSDAVRIQHIKEFGVPESRVAVIDNGVNLNQFRPISPSERKELRASLGASDNELLLLNVGRLTIQKGQDLLLRALAGANLGNRPFRLVLIGVAGHGNIEDAEYETQLRRLAESPSLVGKIQFAGWRDDVPKLLRSADIYVHSANWEGLPLALLEAMASALPSISTDCAGTLTGFVAGRHGEIVQTGNEQALRLAIEKMALLNDVQRTEIGRAAEELVATNFDIATTSRRFVNVIEQVATEPSNVKFGMNE